MITTPQKKLKAGTPWKQENRLFWGGKPSIVQLPIVRFRCKKCKMFVPKSSPRNIQRTSSVTSHQHLFFLKQQQLFMQKNHLYLSMKYLLVLKKQRSFFFHALFIFMFSPHLKRGKKKIISNIFIPSSCPTFSSVRKTKRRW